MKQKGFSQIFIVILLLAIFGGVIYIGFQQRKTTPPTSTPSPSASSDVTANWKTYTDPKGKFSFKYPSGSIIKSNTISQSPVNGEALDKWYKDLFLETIKYDNEATILSRKDLGNAAGIGLSEDFDVDYLVFYIKLSASNVFKVAVYPATGGNNNFNTTFPQILSSFKFTEATSSGSPTPKPVACTMEAKLCPDGSYVGRTGPNCEFAKCP